MPRLKGRQSNNGLSIALLLVLMGIGIAIPLESSNVINFTNIGNNVRESPSVSNETTEPGLANGTIDKVDKIDK